MKMVRSICSKLPKRVGNSANHQVVKDTLDPRSSDSFRVTSPPTMMAIASQNQIQKSEVFLRSGWRQALLTWEQVASTSDLIRKRRILSIWFPCDAPAFEIPERRVPIKCSQDLILRQGDNMQASAASNSSAKVSCVGVLEDLRSAGLFEVLPSVSDFSSMVTTATAACEACSFMFILGNSGTPSTGQSRFRICKINYAQNTQIRSLEKLLNIVHLHILKHKNNKTDRLGMFALNCAGRVTAR